MLTIDLTKQIKQQQIGRYIKNMFQKLAEKTKTAKGRLSAFLEKKVR